MKERQPYTQFGIILHLSWLRSAIAVGVALNELAPTEDDWAELCNDPTFLEEMQAFADVIEDIRKQTAAGLDVGLAALERAGSQHHGRAIEAISVTAERLGVPPEDLLAILLHA